MTTLLESFSRLTNELHNLNLLTFFFRVWPWLISRRRRRLSVAVAPHGLEKMRKKRRKNRTRRNRKRRKRRRPRRMTIDHATVALRRWGKLPYPGHREQDSFWNFNWHFSLLSHESRTLLSSRSTGAPWPRLPRPLPPCLPPLPAARLLSTAPPLWTGQTAWPASLQPTAAPHVTLREVNLSGPCFIPKKKTFYS